MSELLKTCIYNNGFKPLITVVFYMSPQLVGLGPKTQDLVIPFLLGEGETLPDFYLRDLASLSELVLLRYPTVRINNFTGKYIMELSNLKHIQ